MSGLLITVEVRSVYGRDTIYPADDAARAFARIAGTTTLTRDAIREIARLGYTICRTVPSIPGLSRMPGPEEMIRDLS